MIRELQYWPPGAAEARSIRVTISAPVPSAEITGGGDWTCTLSIEGFDESYQRSFSSVDPLAAVLSAAAIAPHLLRTFTSRGSRLTWLDSEHLGFPLLSPPTHTWTFHPADGSAPRDVSVRIGHPEHIDESWSVLLTHVDEGDYRTIERRVHAETWEQALERAAAAVPGLLQEHAESAGGGTLEEAHDPPACRIDDEHTPERSEPTGSP